MRVPSLVFLGVAILFLALMLIGCAGSHTYSSDTLRGAGPCPDGSWVWPC